MKRYLVVAALIFGSALLAVPLIAQESEEEQKSAFIQFVEQQLSTPERQIAFNGLEGIISSEVTARSITVSDDDGVWFTIENVDLNWNQAALLIGRLQVNSLTADSIVYARKPHPVEGFDPPPPEAGGLSVPEFPVAIILDKISVPSVSFGEDVFGLGSEISVDGRLVLEGGSLDTNLAIERLGETGGSLNLDAKYAAADRNLDLELELVEPADGVLVNLLQVEGRPDVRASISGSGPLDALGVDLILDAGGTRALSGRGELSRVEDGFSLSAELGGPIADLMPAPFRPFFGADTSLSAEADIRDSGSLSIKSFNVEGGQLQLSAQAETSDDGFLTFLAANGRIADKDSQAVTLPVPGANTQIDSADFAVDFGTENAWSGALNIANFETADLGAQTLEIDANGAALNLENPTTRRVTFNVDGQAKGIHADDPEIVTAFGESMGFGIAGLWSAGEPLSLAEARFAGQSFEALLSGTISDFIFDGDISLKTASIAPFSGLAGRSLSGGLQLDADGTLALLSGGFDLTLDGQANGLGLDEPALDGLLSTQTVLSGRIARGPEGVTADGFRIASDNSEITADGRFSSLDADFEFGVQIAELNKLDDAISGQLTATGTAIGADSDIELNLSAQIPSGQLLDRSLSDGTVSFAGRLTDGVLDGTLSGDGFVGPHRVTLASGMRIEDGRNHFTDLKFSAGATTLKGGVIQDSEGLFAGDLRLASSDISTAAALALIEASGAVNGDITLSSKDDSQSANLNLSVENLQALDATIGSAEITAAIEDLFGVPMIDGDVNATAVEFAGTTVQSLALTAHNQNAETRFTGNARLVRGAELSLTGSLAAIGDGYRIGLETANISQGAQSAALAKPASLTVADGVVRFDGLDLRVGDGNIVATGSTGETLDIDVDLNAIPLSIANIVHPDLGLSGSLGGTVRVGGSASAPDVSFDIDGSGLNGSTLSEFRIGPVSASANGTFRDNQIRITSASASGNGGLSANAEGVLVLSGSGSDLAITGAVPLSLANLYLANRGTQVSGSAQLDARLTGSLANPRLSGAASADGAEVIDPATLLRLSDIALRADLSSTDVSITQLSANLSGGGSVDAAGTVSLNAANGFPANLTIRLNSARYADGNLFVATASGELALTGGLTNRPLLSGQLQIEQADIAIPDLGSATVAIADIVHVATPADVARTLALANSDGAGNAGSSSDLELDISVRAPNQIFIRGDGLEAEVGGSVRLTGSASNIQPVGGFDLIRGRLEILGRRLEFTEGRATLVGDLDPFINLTARARADGTDVVVNVSGLVSNLEVTVASQPELPEDEVLSLLIFDRGTADLSPLQLVKLASAASELAGGSSLVDGLRDAAGLDQLDIVTDDEGNAAVQAGAYVQDNVYLSVETDAQGESRISIDLDISDNLKARGSTGNDGETSIGIFYEQDY